MDEYYVQSNGHSKSTGISRVSFSQSPSNIQSPPSLHFMQKKVDESLLLLRINYDTIGSLGKHSPSHSASSIFGFLFGMSFLRNLFFLLSSRIFNASLSLFLRIYLGEIHEVDLFSGFAGAAKVNSPLTWLGALLLDYLSKWGALLPSSCRLRLLLLVVISSIAYTRHSTTSRLSTVFI